LYQLYKDRAAFYLVYIQEAHTRDIWQMPINVKQNVVFASPKTYEERGSVANSCVRNLNIQIPALLDNFQNTTEQAYTAWPDRLYVIDKSGRVIYKSKPGPFGFKPSQVQRTLDDTLQAAGT